MNLLRQNNLELKVKNLFRNFALMIVCYFIFFFALRILDILIFDLDFQKYEQIEILKILDENPLKFIFLAAIAAPVIEESIFRSLLKPTTTSLKIFICAILYLIGLLLNPGRCPLGFKVCAIIWQSSFMLLCPGRIGSERIFPQNLLLAAQILSIGMDSWINYFRFCTYL